MPATTNAAQAALRNFVQNLHNAVSERGVHLADAAINVYIATDPHAAGVPYAAADDLAAIYWDPPQLSATKVPGGRAR